MLFFGTETVTARGLQGGVEELEEEVRGFVLRYPSIAGWRASLACIYSEPGRAEKARAE
jgi:hypothetical protein